MTNFSGQLGLFEPAKFAIPVHVVGGGGIGNPLAALLAKLGAQEIHVHDGDRVESHNVPAQFTYRDSDVGMFKVDAVANYLERQESGTRLIRHPEMVTAETEFNGIVMACVDSIDSRRAIWQAVQASTGLVPLYLDGRVGRLKWHLLTLFPTDFSLWAEYEEYLYPEDAVAEAPCAEHAIIHPVGELANRMVGQLVLYAMGKEKLRFTMRGDLEHMTFDAPDVFTRQVPV